MVNEEDVVLQGPNNKQLTKENFADTADELMSSYMEGYSDKKDSEKLTTTKLRKIYGQIMNVYTQISTKDDFDNHKGDIQYLKAKFAYEAGREETVRDFLKKTSLMTILDGVKDYDTFKLYCQYAESLVAYFKFRGGKDN